MKLRPTALAGAVAIAFTQVAMAQSSGGDYGKEQYPQQQNRQYPQKQNPKYDQRDERYRDSGSYGGTRERDRHEDNSGPGNARDRDRNDDRRGRRGGDDDHREGRSY